MRIMLGKMALGFVIAAGLCTVAGAQHIGKYVPIAAGSDADHAMQEINAATDPAQKLALIDKFASELGQGNMTIVADDLYVNYYLAQKNYAKTFEYGDKLFAQDPDNLSNAVNLVHAASEAGDADKLMAYGEITSGILKRFNASTAPAGTSEEQWKQEKASALQSDADNIRYIEQAVYAGAYQTRDPSKRAASLAKFAEHFPDSPYANPALGVAATSYQQAQNVPKMLEVANGLIAKDPNNLGMLLLLADYYGEKGEQLDKAEAYAKKAASLADSAPKPEGVADDQWKQQTTLQKGIALSALGQVNLQKKDNTSAGQKFPTPAPLLKAEKASLAAKQERRGCRRPQLKVPPRGEKGFTAGGAVNFPHKQPPP